MRWNEDARERLKRAARDFGTQQELSDASGVPIPTIQKILSGAGDPGISRVLALANALGMTLDEVILGMGPEAGDWETSLGRAPNGQFRVPICDGHVSAGPGGIVFDGAFPGFYTFPEVWLRTLGNPAEMYLVPVNGDSMVPELTADDYVMFDCSQREPRESMFVFNLDGIAMVKRLRLLGGGEAELVSNNPMYGPIPVKFTDPHLIVGKVVWTGRIMP